MSILKQNIGMFTPRIRHAVITILLGVLLHRFAWGAETLRLQGMCARQARKSLAQFAQSMRPQGYREFSEQNAFSATYDECFEIISFSPVVPPGTKIKTAAEAFAYPTEVDTFMDAYINNDLADCSFYDRLWGVEPGSIADPDSYIKCTIGGKRVTYQQAKEYVNKRMGPGTVH